MNETIRPHAETTTATVAPWDGALYAANTAHHRAHDGPFLASLPLTEGDRVLDIGCGSGDLTRTIADRVPSGHVVGVDAQPTMLAEAEGRAGANQSFVLAPVQRLPDALAGGSRFDVAFSRAVLQWVPLADHLPLFRAIHGLLRPGGWFRLEMGGAGNIPAVVPVLDEVAAGFDGPQAPWTFPDAGTEHDLLEQAGFDVPDDVVTTVAQRRPFSEETLLGWLRSQALQAYQAGMPAAAHAEFAAAAEARLGDMRRADGSYDQTYVRLNALVHRP